MRQLSLLLVAVIISYSGNAQLNITTRSVYPYLETIGLTAVKDGSTFLVLGMAQQNMVLIKTVDGGQQYAIIGNLPSNFAPYRFFVNGDTVISLGQTIHRSTDFGDSWATLHSLPFGDYYYDMACMLNGKYWLTKKSGNNSWLYETDENFNSFTQKYPAPLPGDIRFVSDVSADTVYFTARDTAGYLWLYKTYDNGNNWDTSGILEQFDSESSLPRLSYIQYHSATQASIFSYQFSFSELDYYTTDGFSTLVFDTLLATGHNAHEAIKWISCGERSYLVYDASEISQPGIQEVWLNPDGSSTLGNYQFFGIRNHTSMCHHKDALIANLEDTSISLATGICEATAIEDKLQQAQPSLFPNPTDGMLFIETRSNDVSWKVYDITGRLVQAGNKDRIDISVQPPGMYLVRLWQANGMIRSFPVLKH